MTYSRKPYFLDTYLQKHCLNVNVKSELIKQFSPQEELLLAREEVQNFLGKKDIYVSVNSFETEMFKVIYNVPPRFSQRKKSINWQKVFSNVRSYKAFKFLSFNVPQLLHFNALIKNQVDVLFDPIFKDLFYYQTKGTYLMLKDSVALNSRYFTNYSSNFSEVVGPLEIAEDRLLHAAYVEELIISNIHLFLFLYFVYVSVALYHPIPNVFSKTFYMLIRDLIIKYDLDLADVLSAQASLFQYLLQSILDFLNLTLSVHKFLTGNLFFIDLYSTLVNFEKTFMQYINPFFKVWGDIGNTYVFPEGFNIHHFFNIFNSTAQEYKQFVINAGGKHYVKNEIVKDFQYNYFILNFPRYFQNNNFDCQKWLKENEKKMEKNLFELVGVTNGKEFYQRYLPLYIPSFIQPESYFFFFTHSYPVEHYTGNFFYPNFRRWFSENSVNVFSEYIKRFDLENVINRVTFSNYLPLTSLFVCLLYNTFESPVPMSFKKTAHYKKVLNSSDNFLYKYAEALEVWKNNKFFSKDFSFSDYILSSKSEVYLNLAKQYNGFESELFSEYRNFYKTSNSVEFSYTSWSNDFIQSDLFNFINSPLRSIDRSGV